MKLMQKEKFISALRSGRYTQAHGRLHDVATGGYCCIGVACVELLGEKPDEGGFILGADRTIGWRAERFGISDRDRATLERLNDEGKSFAEIADWIEANIPVEAA